MIELQRSLLMSEKELLVRVATHKVMNINDFNIHFEVLEKDGLFFIYANEFRLTDPFGSDRDAIKYLENLDICDELSLYFNHILNGIDSKIYCRLFHTDTPKLIVKIIIDGNLFEFYALYSNIKENKYTIQFNDTLIKITEKSLVTRLFSELNKKYTQIFNELKNMKKDIKF